MTLSLRPFTKRDTPQLKSWFDTEEDVVQWAGASLQYPIKNSQLHRLMRKHYGAEPEHEVWAVIGHDNTVTGHFQLRYSRRLAQAILGRVAIAPDHRGMGFGAKLIALATRQAFARPWINRIELRVYDFNTPAIKTYKRSGFVEEGTLRQSTPIGNTYWNAVIMSLLRAEFEGFDKRTEGE